MSRFTEYLVQTVNTPYHRLPWYSKLWVFVPLQLMKGLNWLLGRLANR